VSTSGADDSLVTPIDPVPVTRLDLLWSAHLDCHGERLEGPARAQLFRLGIRRLSLRYRSLPCRASHCYDRTFKRADGPGQSREVSRIVFRTEVPSVDGTPSEHAIAVCHHIYYTSVTDITQPSVRHENPCTSGWHKSDGIVRDTCGRQYPSDFNAVRQSLVIFPMVHRSSKVTKGSQVRCSQTCRWWG